MMYKLVKEEKDVEHHTIPMPGLVKSIHAHNMFLFVHAGNSLYHFNIQDIVMG